MTTLFTILLTATYLMSWVMYTKFQLLEKASVMFHNFDDAKKANSQWHIYKGINQLAVYGLVWIIGGFKLALVVATMYWVLFDAMCNVIVLGKDVFYVGKTAQLDKWLRAIASKLNTSPEAVSFMIKGGLIALSLFIYFK